MLLFRLEDDTIFNGINKNNISSKSLQKTMKEIYELNMKYTNNNDINVEKFFDVFLDNNDDKFIKKLNEIKKNIINANPGFYELQEIYKKIVNVIDFILGKDKVFNTVELFPLYDDYNIISYKSSNNPYFSIDGKFDNNYFNFKEMYENQEYFIDNKNLKDDNQIFYNDNNKNLDSLLLLLEIENMMELKKMREKHILNFLKYGDIQDQIKLLKIKHKKITFVTPKKDINIDNEKIACSQIILNLYNRVKADNTKNFNTDLNKNLIKKYAKFIVIKDKFFNQESKQYIFKEFKLLTVNKIARIKDNHKKMKSLYQKYGSGSELKKFFIDDTYDNTLSYIDFFKKYAIKDISNNDINHDMDMKFYKTYEKVFRLDKNPIMKHLDKVMPKDKLYLLCYIIYIYTNYTNGQVKERKNINKKIYNNIVSKYFLFISNNETKEEDKFYFKDLIINFELKYEDIDYKDKYEFNNIIENNKILKNV
jgi:hypothetical protein